MSRNSKPAKPHKVDGFWCLVRRVPARFKMLDDRGIVKVSTRIRVADDPRAVRARFVVSKLDEELHAYWLALKVNWAWSTARKFGFDYIEAAILRAGPPVEVVKRLEALAALSVEEQRVVAPALLGLVELPKSDIELADTLAIMVARRLSSRADDRRLDGAGHEQS